MGDIVVRPFEARDLVAVVEGIRSRSLENHRRRLELQGCGGFVCLVGWLDGRPAGFVGVGLHDDGSPDVLAESRGYAMVSDLYVEGSFRRHGVGRALMGGLEDVARDAGMPGVILHTGVDETFAAAQSLYRALGFSDLGGVYLGGWSDLDQLGVHFVDPLTIWLKPFSASPIAR